MRTAATRNLALAALAVAAIGVLAISRSGGGYEVEAILPQAHGLVDGGDVRAGGQRIGRVTDIALGSDGLPHVRMSVDDGFELREGARADLRFTSVAGEINRYVALTSGDGVELESGAVIPAQRSDAPVEIDQVLGTLDPKTRGEVRGLLAAVDLATRRRGPQIERTLRSSAGALEQVAELLEQARGDGDTIRRVVRDGRATLAALAQDPGALRSAVDELAGTLRTTAARRRELAQVADRIAPALRPPTQALRSARDATGRLRELVASLRPGVRALPGFAADLRPTLRVARPALASARSLADDAPARLRALKPLLRTAKPSLERLSPVLRDAGPMLDQLRTRLPDAFAFLSGWADFGANYDANGHLARVGLVFAPAPVNSIGPSASKAGQLDPPFLRTPGVLEGEPWTSFEDSFASKEPAP